MLSGGPTRTILAYSSSGLASASPSTQCELDLGTEQLGLWEGDTITWFWIGSHAEYDALLARLLKGRPMRGHGGKRFHLFHGMVLIAALAIGFVSARTYLEITDSLPGGSVGAWSNALHQGGVPSRWSGRLPSSWSESRRNARKGDCSVASRGSRRHLQSLRARRWCCSIMGPRRCSSERSRACGARSML